MCFESGTKKAAKAQIVNYDNKIAFLLKYTVFKHSFQRHLSIPEYHSVSKSFHNKYTFTVRIGQETLIR